MAPIAQNGLFLSPKVLFLGLCTDDIVVVWVVGVVVGIRNKEGYCAEQLENN